MIAFSIAVSPRTEKHDGFYGCAHTVRPRRVTRKGTGMFRNVSASQKTEGENVMGCAPVQGIHSRLLQVRDLEAASRVQQKLFPERMPEVPGWEFAGLCRPARMLAGDYYDVFALTPGHVGLALGDVAGKGLGPSLVMASLHAMVRSRLASYSGALPGLMQELNQYLLRSLPEDMFVTLFLGVLHERSGRLSYVNAGHPHPLLVTAEGQEPIQTDNRRCAAGRASRCPLRGRRGSPSAR